MSVSAFTTLHVVISLAAILSGFAVSYGLLKSNMMKGWTLFFLVTTAATTLTGFLFPFKVFTPALGVGIVATIVLAATIAAYYAFYLRGHWRWIYAGGAILSLYLNVFVLVVQSFQKIPAFNAFAPTGSEPPFIVAQAVVLLAFIAVGTLSLLKFQPLRQ